MKEKKRKPTTISLAKYRELHAVLDKREQQLDAFFAWLKDELGVCKENPTSRLHGRRECYQVKSLEEAAAELTYVIESHNKAMTEKTQLFSKDRDKLVEQLRELGQEFAMFRAATAKVVGGFASDPPRLCYDLANPNSEDYSSASIMPGQINHQ